MLILGAFELLAGTACLGSRQVPSSVVNSDRKTWLHPWGRGSSPNNGRQSPWHIVISWPSTFNELRTRRPGHRMGKIVEKRHKQHTSIFLEAPKDIHTCLSTLRLVAEDWAKVAALVIQK